MPCFAPTATPRPVHPRTCGEHMLTTATARTTNGSSPHVRGTFQLLLYDYLVMRFIPARAGNMRIVRVDRKLSSVHPRTCGEHPSAVCYDGQYFGSSPHVRGTSAPARWGGVALRFIPARAGNIDALEGFVFAKPVHPRTCGEHPGQPRGQAHVNGSSPHVRGTYHSASSSDRGGRFIPARAGNILPLLPRNHGTISMVNNLPNKTRQT